MPNYDEKNEISLYKFFEVLDEDIRQKSLSGELSKDQVEQYRVNQLAKQFMGTQFIYRNVEYPALYPIMNLTEALEAAKMLLPVVEETYHYFMQYTEGKSVVSRIDFHFTLAAANNAMAVLKDKGMVEGIPEGVIVDVREYLTKTYKIAINSPKNEYTNPKTGIINSDKIINRYPEMIYVIQDEVIQRIFKENEGSKKLNRQGGSNSFAIVKGNKKESGIILINTVATGADACIAEGQFTYYDWAVMEAIISFYEDAVNRNQDNNGEILLDLKSIHKLLYHNHTSRMSREMQNNILDSNLVQSIKRLLGNYISISDPSGNYDGVLLDGELDFQNGKHCLRVKSLPILLDYIKNNGRNHFRILKEDEITLGLKKNNDERVAIYRYLVQRTNEIFGTYKKTDKQSGRNNKNTNSIPLSNIIKAVYPDYMVRYPGDKARRKKRDFLNNVIAILDAMKDKDYFDDYKQTPRSTDIIFSLERK